MTPQLKKMKRGFFFSYSLETISTVIESEKQTRQNRNEEIWIKGAVINSIQLSCLFLLFSNKFPKFEAFYSSEEIQLNKGKAKFYRFNCLVLQLTQFFFVRLVFKLMIYCK